MAISKRSAERAVSGLKRLLPIIQQQKASDVSEADTVTLVKDVMADVFGFDKYKDLTSEHAIRGTYCDLAVSIEGELLELVEVKSAGTPLEDRHVKQAIDYAANAQPHGVDWVVLTNGSVWRLYEVLFGKPIDKRLLIEVDLTTLDLRGEDCVNCLAPFMKEGFAKEVQKELRDRQDATSKYLLSALILNNDSVAARIRLSFGAWSMFWYPMMRFAKCFAKKLLSAIPWMVRRRKRPCDASTERNLTACEPKRLVKCRPMIVTRWRLSTTQLLRSRYLTIPQHRGNVPVDKSR